jgi:hypothetical protein
MTVEDGTRVQVHRNLTRGDWVIKVRGRNAKGQMVWTLAEYRDEVSLVNCVEKASVKGAERIRRNTEEKGKPCREVVAKVEGTLIETRPAHNGIAIRYNPHRRNDFHTSTGESFASCDFAHFPIGAHHFDAEGVRCE